MEKLIETVFSVLLENKAIKNANMRYLINDRGIADEYFCLIKKTFKQAGKSNDRESLYVMLYMCWGAGAFFASSQWTLGKTLDKFTNTELDSMFKALSEDDAVGLGYDALGILSGSYNYNLITKGIQAAYLATENLNSPTEALMQIFFNAGVTMAYERFER